MPLPAAQFGAGGRGRHDGVTVCTRRSGPGVRPAWKTGSRGLARARGHVGKAACMAFTVSYGASGRRLPHARMLTLRHEA